MYNCIKLCKHYCVKCVYFVTYFVLFQGKVITKVWTNGQQGEDMDYFADHCDGVQVRLGRIGDKHPYTGIYIVLYCIVHRTILYKLSYIYYILLYCIILFC